MQALASTPPAMTESHSRDWVPLLLRYCAAKDADAVAAGATAADANGDEEDEDEDDAAGGERSSALNPDKGPSNRCVSPY